MNVSARLFNLKYPRCGRFSKLAFFINRQLLNRYATHLFDRWMCTQ